MKHLSRTFLAAVLAAVTSSALAVGSVKDIVLERVSAPAISQPGDVMAVSVLQESVDGALTARGTNALFRTGDRFRVKLLASRDAKVSFYNTNPKGVMNPKPIWQGDVQAGQETISSRLALTGTSGVDLLHIVMEPSKQRQVVIWLESWLLSIKDSAGVNKDIQVDVQNTPNATYLLNATGQGLVSTMQIVHNAR
ncbi:MAG: hypothetical protein IPN53_16340 [Comamonadaceae bacterium]|nr:hypothetical protein [Comamonadaceae bacterium]